MSKVKCNQANQLNKKGYDEDGGCQVTYREPGMLEARQ